MVFCCCRGEDFKFGCTNLRVPAHVLSKLKDHINVSPNGVAFVKQHVRKGVISRCVFAFYLVVFVCGWGLYLVMYVCGWGLYLVMMCGGGVYI